MSIPYVVDGETDLDSALFNPIIDGVNFGGGPTLNVLAYGSTATGDGDADDTQVFQDAFTAAAAVNGTLLIPQPRSEYNITSTIEIEPPSGQEQTRIKTRSDGGIFDVQWRGGDAASVIRARGLKDSHFQNLHINNPDDADDLVFWDLVVDSDIGSISQNKWTQCSAHLRDGYAGTGWLYRNEGGSGDQSNFFFDTCVAEGDTHHGKGGIGWHNINPNALIHSWKNCYAYNLYSMYSANPRQGKLSADINASVQTIGIDATMIAQLPRGGGTILIETEQITYTGISGSNLTGCTRGANGTSAASHLINVLASASQSTANEFGSGGFTSGYFDGSGGGYNEWDYQLGVGNYMLVGGRMEEGRGFIYTGEYGVIPGHITLMGQQIERYDPASYLMYFGAPAHVSIQTSLFMGTDFSGKFINVGGPSDQPYGIIDMRTSTVQSSDDDLFHVESSTVVNATMSTICGSDFIPTGALEVALP